MLSLAKFIKRLPPKGKVVDIGCGSSRDAKVFTDNGLTVLGIDFCQDLIDIAKASAPSAEFAVADIETLALFTPSLESSVTKEGLSVAKEAGKSEFLSEKAVTEEVNMAETLTFPAPSFDGAWACCSLGHVPKKHCPLF